MPSECLLHGLDHAIATPARSRLERYSTVGGKRHGRFAHHTAITGDISRQDRRQPSLDALLGHVDRCLLDARKEGKFYVVPEEESMEADCPLQITFGPSSPRFSISAMVE